MTRFRSTQDFLSAVRTLIDKWCDERKLVALMRVLPSYCGFNGLTDGWEELRTALSDARAGLDSLDSDRLALNELILAATEALARR